MEFTDVVQRRRMVRNYTGEPVGPDVLDRILDTGIRIPSAGFSQGVFLVAVTDAETRGEIARLCGEEEYVADGFDPWISEAPVHILVCVSSAVYADRYAAADKGGPDSPMADADNWPIPYWWVDGGAAMQNLLLAAVDEVAKTEGLLLCPEGAATYAAYQEALADGRVGPGERAVLYNCATGLKYPMPKVDRRLDRHGPIDYAAL